MLMFCCCMPGFTKAQSPFMNDGNGRPLYWGSTYVMEGNPFLFDDYKWAEVTTGANQVYKDVRVKINMQDMLVQYILDDGTEMVTSTPIKSVRFIKADTNGDSLTDVLITAGGAILNKPESPVYQVLASGKITLLKKISLSYRDGKKYGEATTTRVYTRTDSYLISQEGSEPMKLEKERYFITELMKDKRSAIDKFIEKKKIRFRSIEDIRLLILHYNTLQ